MHANETILASGCIRGACRMHGDPEGEREDKTNVIRKERGGIKGQKKFGRKKNRF
jgi:hypothetical protein